MRDPKTPVSGLSLSLIFLFILAGCAMAQTDHDEAPAFDPGPWFVEYIGERPVIDRSPANFLFGRDGTVSGAPKLIRGKRRAVFRYPQYKGVPDSQEPDPARPETAAALKNQDRY